MKSSGILRKDKALCLDFLSTRIGRLTLLSHQFCVYNVQSYVVIQHFLIYPIFYEGSTLINISFLIKKDTGFQF